jgi:hypothetical protein
LSSTRTQDTCALAADQPQSLNVIGTLARRVPYRRIGRLMTNLVRPACRRTACLVSLLSSGGPVWIGCLGSSD